MQIETFYIISSAIIIIAILLFKSKKIKPTKEIQVINQNKDLTNFECQIIQKLNFKDAMLFDRATQELRSGSSFDKIKNAPFFDFASITLQVLDVIKSKNIIQAAFPDHIQSLIDSGTVTQMVTKDGRKLLIAVDKSGKILSHAQQISPNVVSNLAKLSSIIVSAAHIISGHDNAKQLKAANKKLDIIISKGFDEQFSKLEAIYESMREHIHDAHNESKKNISTSAKA